MAGYDSSIFDLDTDPGHVLAALRRARNNGARLIVVCLPPAKQIMLRRFEPGYRPAVGIGAGASLSFYVGEMKRSPAWMSRCGLEWLHRLAHEPPRLWRRHLFETPRAVPLLVGMAVRRVLGRPTCRTCTLQS